MKPKAGRFERLAFWREATGGIEVSRNK